MLFVSLAKKDYLGSMKVTKLVHSFVTVSKNPLLCIMFTSHLEIVIFFLTNHSMPILQTMINS